MKKALILFGLLVLFSCNQSHESAQGQWIKGSEQEKIDAIERNIGGFGTAMMEVGYRYQELYWAGKDQNWEYAEYQLDDLREAIENGLERRPNRAQSAEHFLNVTLPDMEEAIQKKDSSTFFVEFERLQTGCNNCHQMEEVPFIRVGVPGARLSSIELMK